MDDTRLKRALEIVGELAKDPYRWTLIDSQQLDEMRNEITALVTAQSNHPQATSGYDYLDLSPEPGYAQHKPCDCYNCVIVWLGERGTNCLIVRGGGPGDVWAYRRGNKKVDFCGNVSLETVARLLLHNMIVESGSKDPHLRRFVRR